MLAKTLKMLACSCGKSLQLTDSSNGEQISSGKMKCIDLNHHDEYQIRNGIPNLLPPKIKNRISTWERFTSKITWNKPILTTEKILARQIIASNNMASKYYKNVVDPFLSVQLAKSFERYEDLFLLKEIRKKVDRNKRVVFIEMGCGPGRYFLLLGSKISRAGGSEFKNHPDLKNYFEYDKKFDENLLHIIGIDFSEEMIKRSIILMKKHNLDNLLYDRITPIIGNAQNLKLNLSQFNDAHKIVTCMFQTLGNQETNDLRVNLLKSMKKLASPNGTVIVSVFDKNQFQKMGKEFYQVVEPTVGKSINNISDDKEAILRTEKGVYSKWFSKQDLKEVFKAAEMRAEIKDESNLKPFVEHDRYVRVHEQKKYVIPRALIAIAHV